MVLSFPVVPYNDPSIFDNMTLVLFYLDIFRQCSYVMQKVPVGDIPLIYVLLSSDLILGSDLHLHPHHQNKSYRQKHT